MRLLCLFAVLCALGCANVASSSVTLDNLVYSDPTSAATQHPLVCGAGRDFPAGRELAFTNPSSGEFVHAVFPKGVMPPSELDGKLILHGHYQTIQNKQIYRHKTPADDYRYFVVSSWKYEK